MVLRFKQETTGRTEVLDIDRCNNLLNSYEEQRSIYSYWLNLGEQLSKNEEMILLKKK